MRRLLPFIVFLLLAAPRAAQAQISATLAAYNIDNGNAVTSASTGSLAGWGFGNTYNQPAGDCIDVLVVGAGATFSTPPTDTASDTFATAIGSYTGNNTFQYVNYYVQNSNGNAANVITIPTGSISYGWIYYYDIPNCNNSSPLDAAVKATSSGSVTSLGATFSTVQANEVVISFIGIDSGNISTATQPTGYTKDTFPGASTGFGGGAHLTVSSLQSSVTLTWTSLASAPYDTQIVSFRASGGASSSGGFGGKAGIGGKAGVGG